jgi:hypothetical protein
MMMALALAGVVCITINTSRDGVTEHISMLPGNYLLIASVCRTKPQMSVFTNIRSPLPLHCLPQDCADSSPERRAWCRAEVTQQALNSPAELTCCVPRLCARETLQHAAQKRTAGHAHDQGSRLFFLRRPKDCLYLRDIRLYTLLLSPSSRPHFPPFVFSPEACSVWLRATERYSLLHRHVPPLLGL